MVYRITQSCGTECTVLAEHWPDDAGNRAAEANASLRKHRHGQRDGLLHAPIVANEVHTGRGAFRGPGPAPVRPGPDPRGR